jgi:beta-glucosidase
VLELAGFRRVHLEPGQAARVEFGLEISQLAFLDADMRWRVEAGDVDVMVGASSEDLRLTDMISIGSDAFVDGKTRGFYAL